jgi:hypothetical protein
MKMEIVDQFCPALCILVIVEAILKIHGCILSIGCSIPTGGKCI